MKKTFCNFCETEITEKNDFYRLTQGLSSSPENSLPHIIYSAVSTYIEDDDIDLCKHCFIDQIKRLDDRPPPDSQAQERLNC